MLDTTNVIILTERLKLVPISLTNRNDIFNEFTKSITMYMIPQPSGDIKDVDAFINDSLVGMKKGSNLQLVALNKQTDEFLGCVALHNIDKKDPKMGVWFKKNAHGNKYGQEAMKGIKNWADHNLDYDHIKYPVAVANIASRKIAERLGGKVAREFIGKRQDGQDMPEVEYIIKR